MIMNFQSMQYFILEHADLIFDKRFVTFYDDFE